MKGKAAKAAKGSKVRARCILAVNYSFNLSGNPEKPILFLLSGDVLGTAYCGCAPPRANKINLSKHFAENIAAKNALGGTFPRGTFPFR